MIDKALDSTSSVRLRGSERIAECLFQSNAVGMLLADREKVVDANEEFLRITGYSRDDLFFGRINLRAMTPPEFKHLDDKCIFQLTGRGSCAFLEKEYIRKDGTRVPVLTGGTLLEREPLKWICFVLDNTARKQAEQNARFLLDITAQMERIDSPEELLKAVTEALGNYFKASLCFFNEIDIEGDNVIAHAVFHGGLALFAEEYDRLMFCPQTIAQIKTGCRSINCDTRNDPRTAADYESVYRPSGCDAYASVPVLHQGKPVSTLWIGTDQAREWSETELKLLEAVAERAWSAYQKDCLNAAGQEQLRLLSQAMDAAGVGAWVSDLENKTLCCSPRLRTIMGISPEEPFSYRAFSNRILHPDDRKMVSDAFQRALRERCGYETKFRIVRPADGTVHWLHAKGEISYREDNPLKLLGAIVDITDRKEAEDALNRTNEALKEQIEASKAEIRRANESLNFEIEKRKRTEGVLLQREREFKILIENSPDIISRLDKDLKHLYISPAVERYTGMAPELYIGKSLEVLGCPEEVVNGFTETCNRVFQSGQPGDCDITLAAPSGEKTVHECRIIPERCETGSVESVMIIARDITERIQTEEALGESEEQVRYLSSRLLEAHEEERKRVAGDLHTIIDSFLGAIKHRIEAAILQTEENAPSRISLQAAVHMIEHTIETLKK